LLDQVAAVGGGVDGDVARPASGAALQDGLEGGKVVVVGGKAQIVDEQDELEGVGGQLVHQVGQEVELVLFHFHQAQALGGVLVGDGLHRAGFAGAGVPVQKHVVGRQARQQAPGVGKDLFPLPLVAGQVRQALGVGVAHRGQPAFAVQHKDVVPGKHPVPHLPQIGTAYC